MAAGFSSLLADYQSLRLRSTSRGRYSFFVLPHFPSLLFSLCDVCVCACSHLQDRENLLIKELVSEQEQQLRRVRAMVRIGRTGQMMMKMTKMFLLEVAGPPLATQMN